ncbi:hypothetical protein BGZ60DRAFT_469659 [Tricladium varicosporioides]|nr:hypothetical protein BGZ60DRAFT_469659 [Hymenoscyphus varicosporioides]
MLRHTTTRSLLKNFPKAASSRSSYSAASATFRNAIPSRQLSYKRPQILPAFTRPTTSLLYATQAGSPFDRIDTKTEHKIGERVIHPDAAHVDTESSIRHVFEKSQVSPGAADESPLASIKGDIETIKETFSLGEVPKESLYIGAAGVLPYAATSLSSLYLAYDINHAHATGGAGYLFSPDTARQLLEIITPIQIGYGAVIISFLGAIHWGLEYAGYGGHHSYRRYMYGVIAPAIAWPTIFMPVEYALITQFLTFNFLYFADARATVRGWFPPWYSTYRFVLTFFVGASIVMTLVGRGQIVKSDSTLKNPAEYLKQDRDAQWEALEYEEKERRATIVKKEEEEGGRDGENKDDDGADEEDGNKTN